ncbi:acyl-[acyl-carrier-protein] thioesterase [Bacteriovorax sp. Seq25_V]|uniref:acyl-[acyl-carrier-protein] thioesterase n=1 Tax=Bacteriovorax sp. Seq25_V TaxID=1201288 RepID=UPI000389E00E|nr:acyl-ACP thioesterase domain-containing protein [Bacteriovorax sp. Seq25_V]EQC48019.1 acyl-ACP thioesterase [Bacteriovorax sp. Seq25_V]
MKKIYKDSVFTYLYHINAGDVCPKGQLSLKKLMLLFQNIALDHYTSRAQTWDELVKKKQAWVLTKIELDLRQTPFLAQDIKLSTWSRGTQQFKGFREFEVTCEDKTLITANTSWIYLDLVKKSPVAFNQSLFPNFTPSTTSNFEGLDNTWRIKEDFNLQNEIEYKLRYTDYDINNHLNNTVYFELLEDYMMNNQIERPKKIRAIFKKEVPFHIKALELGMIKNESCYTIVFKSESETHFLAELEF